LAPQGKQDKLVKLVQQGQLDILEKLALLDRSELDPPVPWVQLDPMEKLGPLAQSEQDHKGHRVLPV
jgi:hypothetical protein